jgi:hypothetical protein
VKIMVKKPKKNKEQSEIKKPQIKHDKKDSCGCGCIPLAKTK